LTAVGGHGDLVGANGHSVNVKVPLLVVAAVCVLPSLNAHGGYGHVWNAGTGLSVTSPLMPPVMVCAKE